MDNWYCSINGQQYGPVPTDELLNWIRQGRVTAVDSVWCEGMDQWAPAGNVPAFAGQFSQTATAPPMPGSPYAGRPHGKPHRGATVLTLGILGLAVCCICGIVAWAMGNADLREMAAGRMDRSGEGLTVAGKICGIISVIIVSVIMVIYLFVLIAVFVAHGSSAM